VPATTIENDLRDWSSLEDLPVAVRECNGVAVQPPEYASTAFDEYLDRCTEADLNDGNCVLGSIWALSIEAACVFLIYAIWNLRHFLP
jgi:hypothetical protein